MSMPKNKGVMCVPDMYLYYLAYNARFPIVWGYSVKYCEGNWDWLEGQIIKEHNRHISLTSSWYCPKNLSSLNKPMIKFSVSITKTLHKR